MYSLQREGYGKHLKRGSFVDTQKLIEKAAKENPEIALVLEISARAREIEQREPAKELRPTTDVGANPTAAQGVISSGHVLHDQRDLTP